MEISTKKISHMGFSFETQFKIEFFYHHLPVVKNAKNFLRTHGADEERMVKLL